MYNWLLSERKRRWWNALSIERKSKEWNGEKHANGFFDALHLTESTALFISRDEARNPLFVFQVDFFYFTSELNSAFSSPNNITVESRKDFSPPYFKMQWQLHLIYYSFRRLLLRHKLWRSLNNKSEVCENRDYW